MPPHKIHNLCLTSVNIYKNTYVNKICSKDIIYIYQIINTTTMQIFEFLMVESNKVNCANWTFSSMHLTTLRLTTPAQQCCHQATCYCTTITESYSLILKPLFICKIPNYVHVYNLVSYKIHMVFGYNTKSLCCDKTWWKCIHSVGKNIA